MWGNIFLELKPRFENQHSQNIVAIWASKNICNNCWIHLLQQLSWLLTRRKTWYTTILQVVLCFVNKKNCHPLAVCLPFWLWFLFQNCGYLKIKKCLFRISSSDQKVRCCFNKEMTTTNSTETFAVLGICAFTSFVLSWIYMAQSVMCCFSGINNVLPSLAELESDRKELALAWSSPLGGGGWNSGFDMIFLSQLFLFYVNTEVVF